MRYQGEPDELSSKKVRGEHANLTYRVNGVLLPEPLNDFGQAGLDDFRQRLTLSEAALKDSEDKFNALAAKRDPSHSEMTRSLNSMTWLKNTIRW